MLYKHRRVYLWGALAIVLIVAGYLYRASLYKLAYRFDLVRRDEAFTELYFDDPEALPKSTTKNKTETFSFTIHNVEGSNMDYPYVVYFMNDKGYKTVFAQGTVALADGAYQTITVAHTFTASHQRGTVAVVLTNLNQHIDFLIADTSS
ncbi:MAG TPA: hypothetical protein VG621_03195 [Candidatus Paceibacterota bacterium]|nr:hypothetical protein [Candidatus Paceibacterota bacterium]